MAAHAPVGAVEEAELADPGPPEDEAADVLTVGPEDSADEFPPRPLSGDWHAKAAAPIAATKQAKQR